jgi:cytidine deaminase
LDSPLSEEQISALLEEARARRAHAYAAYSGFSVGACVLAGGRIYSGVNVENASYPLSMCAERNAVAAAIAAGENAIAAVAIVGGGRAPAPPCGGCRQVLSEFGAGATVVAESDGGERRRWTVEELLPSPFEASALE